MLRPLVPVIGALLVGAAALTAQTVPRRPLSEIVHDLERLTSELRGLLDPTPPTPPPDPAPTVHQAADAGELHAALVAAQPGEVIELTPGVQYVGTFRAPEKPIGKPIILRTRGAVPVRRITDADRSLLATLAAATNEGALRFEQPGAWTVEGVALLANPGGLSDVVVIQGGADIVLDRLLIVGGPDGQKRAVRGNGRRITLTRSHIANIWKSGQDSQAFCAWDGAGPFTITDNYLEAASENILFGGADSTAADRIPADILIEGNHLTKRDEWRGGGKVVKNLLELKAAKRVIIRDNLFEKSWTDAQTGFGIAFTVRNQDGRAPWSATEDVLFEHNIVRDVDRGISMMGRDNQKPSGQTTRLMIRHNLIVARWDAMQMGAELGDVLVDHNTIINANGKLLNLYRGDVMEPTGTRRPAAYTVDVLVWTNTVGRHNAYGVFGEGAGIGAKALSLARTWTWWHNVVAGGSASYVYPDTTLRPTVADFEAAFPAPSYTLIPGHPWQTAATDGTALGR